ncbi:MAG: DMT family transporter [Gemmatimonadaceae bacterium]
MSELGSAAAAPYEPSPGASPVPRRTLFGALEVLGAAACFSALPIFTIIATERGGASLETALAGRYLLGAVALLAIAGAAVRLKVERGELWRMVLLGGMGQAAIAWLALSALAYLPAATMVFLFYTFPAWVAVIAAVRRTEPLTPMRIVALVLALGGIWALVGSPWAGTLHPAGILLTLAAALTYAVYIPFIGSLQRNVGPVIASMYVSLGAGLTFLLGGMLSGRITTISTTEAWIGIVGMAIVSTAAAFILFLRGLALLGPVRTAIVSTGEPFFVTILGVLVLDQAASRAILLGGALVAAAVILIATAREQLPRP